MVNRLMGLSYGLLWQEEIGRGSRKLDPCQRVTKQQPLDRWVRRFRGYTGSDYSTWDSAGSFIYVR